MNELAAFEQAARSLPRSQGKVADYIVKHPNEVAFMTIEQLSQKVGVSTTTVMRLASSLGYAGYTEMMIPFKNNILQEVTPVKRFASSNVKSGEGEFAVHFMEAETAMLNSTISCCDYATIEKAVKMIEKAKKVYIIGYRISYMTMGYLYQCMQRIRANCILLEPGGFDLIENIARITRDDLVIGCVLPRYYSLVPDVLKTAKERGAKTIAFTDSYNSPVSPDTDLMLICNCEGASFHASILGTVYVADYILSLLAKRDTSATVETLTNTESVFEEYRRKLV